ncbi:MAG: ABC transporter ATP-binding protein [Candidatus Dormibacteraeota bacterium]|nr:ABC transporter ATP-binding protein [Candidatus Dormibacteraeota bacterium]
MEQTNGTASQEPDQRPVALHARGLTKRYGMITAVDGLTLDVRRGEVYGFLGPNGAGKTTTMRMLVGLIRPTSGSAQVLGRPPGDPRALARLGALIETPAFYPYLSGRANLEVLAGHAHVPKPRIDDVLEVVRLAGRASDRYSSYSLGMKQRLGVAAALLKDPELLILDEPTNGLDPIGVAHMRSLIRGLADEGRAVMLSSHELGEVQRICDRVGVIFRGRLVTESTVSALRGGTGVVVRAAPLPRAQALLAHLFGDEKVALRDHDLRLQIAPERASEVARRLVLAGIDVHELRADERSLEEVFMAMSAEFDAPGRDEHAV